MPTRTLNNEIGDNNVSLLDALRSGDHEAFSHIYLHFWDSMNGFIRNLIGSPEEAKEMTQEIFTLLWENRHRIDSDRTAGIKPYLYGIARNKVMDWFDHKRVESRFQRLTSWANAEDNSPDEAMIALETEFITQLVVEQMPKTRREVFTMIVQRGLSIEEVAQHLQISKAAVSTHLYHARRELKNFLTAILIIYIVLSL